MPCSWSWRKSFPFSPLSIMLAVCLLYMVFIMLRYFPSMLHLWRIFIMKGYWILTKAFFSSIEMIMRYWPFILLMWSIIFIDVCVLNHNCFPGVNPTWSQCIIILMCSWMQFASISLRVFISIFTRNICLYFLFLWCPYLALVTG